MYDLLAYNDGYSSKSGSICVFFYRDKTLLKKKDFQKFVKRREKIKFSLVFVCFLFMEMAWVNFLLKIFIFFR